MLISFWTLNGTNFISLEYWINNNCPALTLLKRHLYTRKYWKILLIFCVFTFSRWFTCQRDELHVVLKCIWETWKWRLQIFLAQKIGRTVYILYISIFVFCWINILYHLGLRIKPNEHKLWQNEWHNTHNRGVGPMNKIISTSPMCMCYVNRNMIFYGYVARFFFNYTFHINTLF